MSSSTLAQSKGQGSSRVIGKLGTELGQEGLAIERKGRGACGGKMIWG